MEHLQITQYVEQNYSMTIHGQIFVNRLRSAVGERGKWSGERRAAFSESQPERNAAAERQTEARRSYDALRMPARDERAGLRSGMGVVVRGTGPTGCLWSGVNRALVTA